MAKKNIWTQRLQEQFARRDPDSSLKQQEQEPSSSSDEWENDLHKAVDPIFAKYSYKS